MQISAPKVTESVAITVAEKPGTFNKADFAKKSSNFKLRRKRFIEPPALMLH